MKSTLLLLFVSVFFILNCNAAPKKEGTKEKVAINTLTEKEKKAGWILLFDGKTSDGWRGYNKTNFPADWIIEDGSIRLKGSGNGEAGSVNGGDLVYGKQKFANFHLKIDWKISDGGNSGIFYLAQEIPGKEIWRTAPEFQVLDNERHPDAMLGVDGNRQAGSLYDLIPAKPQNTKPSGEWNCAEILSYQGTVIHFQNGQKILEYHLWTPEWNELVKNSKFPTYNPDWAKVAKEGLIGLQDHGNDVWYRNVKIQIK